MYILVEGYNCKWSFSFQVLFFGVKVHRVNAPPGALTMYTDQKINMYVLCTVDGFLE